MATGSLIYFPKQSKRTTPRKSKPTDKKKPAAKATVRVEDLLQRDTQLQRQGIHPKEGFEPRAIGAASKSAASLAGISSHGRTLPGN